MDATPKPVTKAIVFRLFVFFYLHAGLSNLFPSSYGGY